MTHAPTQVDTGILGARVAAYGLTDREPRVIEAPLDDLHFDQLLSVCRRQRTVGLLAAAAAAGDLPATDGQVGQAEAAHLEVMGTAVMLEQLLVWTSTVLAGAGVRHRVLKGAAFAHLDWPDPSLRTFNDVDLLVAGDTDVAVSALAAAGCTRRTAEVSPGFDRRFGKGTTMRSPSGDEIDVHRTLAAGPFGLLIRLDELLDSAAVLPLGGIELHALGRPQRLVHACYHAALGDARPADATCRDVGELVLESGPVDRDAALQLARSWEGQPAVARGVVLAADLLELSEAHPLVSWARAYEPTAVERRRLRAYVGRERSFARQALEGWRVLPTARERIAYGRHLVFASRDHLDGRHESAPRRLAHTVRLLTRGGDRGGDRGGGR